MIQYHKVLGGNIMNKISEVVGMLPLSSVADRVRIATDEIGCVDLTNIIREWEEDFIPIAIYKKEGIRQKFYTPFFCFDQTKINLEVKEYMNLKDRYIFSDFGYIDKEELIEDIEMKFPMRKTADLEYWLKKLTTWKISPILSLKLFGDLNVGKKMQGMIIEIDRKYLYEMLNQISEDEYMFVRIPTSTEVYELVSHPETFDNSPLEISEIRILNKSEFLNIFKRFLSNRVDDGLLLGECNGIFGGHIYKHDIARIIKKLE